RVYRIDTSTPPNLPYGYHPNRGVDIQWSCPDADLPQQRGTIVREVGSPSSQLEGFRARRRNARKVE
ncbi:MAG: hypothetical protein Q9184_005305, partial [Pyrenodesmia sp. 2 TL-2023]